MSPRLREQWITCCLINNINKSREIIKKESMMEFSNIIVKGYFRFLSSVFSKGDMLNLRETRKEKHFLSRDKNIHWSHN